MTVLSRCLFACQDGNIELARGYGFANVENEKPFTADSKFAVASVSKSFTTTLAAKLFAADNGYASCPFAYWFLKLLSYRVLTVNPYVECEFCPVVSGCFFFVFCTM